MVAAAAVSVALAVPVVVPEAQLPVPAGPLVPAAPHSLRESVAPLLAQLLVLVPLVPARVPVVAHLVVEPEVLLHLRSRPSFSAAMARSSPPTGKPTCERVPSTR